MELSKRSRHMFLARKKRLCTLKIHFKKQILFKFHEVDESGVLKIKNEQPAKLSCGCYDIYLKLIKMCETARIACHSRDFFINQSLVHVETGIDLYISKLAKAVMLF